MSKNLDPRFHLNVKLSSEVRYAIDHNLPVVALESNVIANGLPYPRNLSLATECNAIFKRSGVVPAVIFVKNRCVHVGSKPEDLELLASLPDVPKFTSRDLALSRLIDGVGSTTVGASLAICALVGLPLFASAGLGGVHRDVDETFDVSSDIYDLARYNVCVVSAGMKSFLDIPKSTELLESLSIPVVGFKTDSFPRFYCQGNTGGVNYVADSWDQVAVFSRTHRSLGGTGVLVVCNPSDETALDLDLVDGIISQALGDAALNNVKGKDLTKHVMRYIDDGTGSRSSQANYSVMLEVCDHAARLAKLFFDPR